MHENKHYTLCDLNQFINYNPIHIQKRSNAYLSANADYVIIEEEQFINDEDPNTPLEFKPGNISVYDAKTSELKASLNLPPQGRIEILDNYPDRFYYLTSDSLQQPIRIDLEFNNFLSVHLLDSQNNLLSGGQLKYYEGGWKDAVDNGDGTFRVETDRSTVSLRMIYEYASQDMADVPVSGGPAVFQTVSCEVQLESSTGQLMEEGTVKYYAGGWRDFGVTSGGTAVRELLPKTCTFRAAYSGSHVDTEQDVSVNPVLVIVIE